MPLKSVTMMILDSLCLEIQNKYLAGETWQSIADDYSINSAMTRLIALGYQPGKKISAALHLPPVCPSCQRRVPRPRVTSDWPLDEAVANLKRLLELKKGINHVEETETI